MPDSLTAELRSLMKVQLPKFAALDKSVGPPIADEALAKWLQQAIERTKLAAYVW